MITDTSEFTPFGSFNSVGIITTDTFNLWRKKDNGIIQLINLYASNSVSSGIDVNNDTATISIKTGGVITANLANSAVTGEKIANLTITEGKFADGAVTESKIGALAVTEGKIGALAVTEGKIGANAIVTIKIADGAVTESKIASSAVTEGKIGALAVTEGKIGVGAVTVNKIGSLAVTESKIASSAVTEGKIGALAVTEGKIGALAVTEGKIGVGAVTVNKIGNSAVSTDKLAAGAITAGKLSGLQTGSAPIFAARAWARLKPYTTDGNLNETSWRSGFTFSRSSNTTTVTGGFPHGLRAGDKIYLDFSSGIADGLYTVSATGLTTSSFVLTDTPIGSNTSGTVTLRFVQILQSGNVASATFYDNDSVNPRYVLNFTIPLSSSNYVTVGMGIHRPGAGTSVIGELTMNDLQLNSTTQCYLRDDDRSRFANIVVFG